MAVSKRPAVESFPSFPCLVASRLSATAPGTVQAMADLTGIDHATLLKWMRGRTKTPPEAMVRQWAKAMRVPVEDALARWRDDQIRRLNGQPVPLPDLSFIRPGPPPRPDSVRSLRRLRRLLPIAGGSSHDGTLPVLSPADAIPLIRRWLARGWDRLWRSSGWGTPTWCPA